MGVKAIIEVAPEHIGMLGSYKVYFGYLLDSDELVFNKETPLSFKVTPSESQFSE